MKLLRAFGLLVLVLLAAGSMRAHAARPVVVVVRLVDTIQPISEDYVYRALSHAADIKADAVLIEMDTPGGLLSSMRNMAGRIGSSPVPVIVYVAPTGARAGSAGFFLLEAADIAAMAPGTNAGAAHPVVEGAKLDDTMKQKLENDAAAFLRSYTVQRGRNPKAAEDAVRNSKSYTAQECQQLGLIDLIAPDRDALLRAADGRTITRLNGTKLVLHTRDAVLDTVKLALRDRVLDVLINPDLAILMLVLGALLIYLEFNVPGTIVPGALGTLLVVLSLFALNLLPVRDTAVLLLLAAIVLMVLDLKFAGHGVLSGAGIVSLVLGMMTLVDGPVPELRVHPGMAIAVGLGFGLITIFLLRLAIRARRSKSVVGVDALMGETAVVLKPLEPVGQVLVHGEIWEAQSATPAARDAQVRITGVHGLTLHVEPLARP